MTEIKVVRVVRSGKKDLIDKVRNPSPKSFLPFDSLRFRIVPAIDLELVS